jgi:hypothetical protein
VYYNKFFIFAVFLAVCYGKSGKEYYMQMFIWAGAPIISILTGLWMLRRTRVKVDKDPDFINYPDNLRQIWVGLGLLILGIFIAMGMLIFWLLVR